MKKLKNHTIEEYKKALIDNYTRRIKSCRSTKIELQSKCIEEYVCPNCLKRTVVSDSKYIFSCSECDFTLTEKQCEVYFKKLFF